MCFKYSWPPSGSVSISILSTALKAIDRSQREGGGDEGAGAGPGGGEGDEAED